MSKEKKHSNKRLHLISGICLAILILLCVAGIMYLLMLRGSASSGSDSSDTAALESGSTASTAVTFSKIPASEVPNFASFYGKKISKVKKKCASTLSFGSVHKVASAKKKSLIKYTVKATVLSKAGAELGTATFKLNKKKCIVTAECALDMDSLGVQSADFQVLAYDSTVPASFLKAAGVKSSAIDAKKLDADNAGTLASTATQETCTFKGSTGAKSKKKVTIKKVKSKKTGKKVKKKKVTYVQVAFQTWELVEEYDYSQRQDNGSGSVIRTLHLSFS